MSKLIVKIHKTYFVFIVLLCWCFYGFSQHKKPYVLSSGPQNENYHNTGNYLEKLLEELYPEYRFKNISSLGSQDNLHLLDTRFSDFAISQRDALLENLYDEENGMKNIEIILPLFEEDFMIYTGLNTENFKSFEHFSKNVGTVGTTNKDSHSFQVFEKICKLLGINLNDLTIVEDTNENLAELLQSESLDIVISFSLPIEVFEKQKSIKKIGFSKDEIALISSKLSNIFPSEKVQIVGKTFGSWTFLIGLNSSVNTINKHQKKGISENLILALTSKNDSIAKDILKSVTYFEQKEHQKILIGIPLTNSFSSYINYSYKHVVYQVLLVLILIALFIFLYFYRYKIKHFDYRLIWAKYKYIIIGVFSIILIYFLSIECLLMCEEKFYSDLGIKSKILNLTKVDLHLWTLITNLTGNNNNIFPLSYSGQMILSFSAYIVVLGPVAVALAEFINYRITKKRIHGMKNLKLDKHIVIIGWKDNTIHFLEELTSVNNTALEKKHQIVCIVQNPEELIKNNENLKKLHIKRTVEFVKGDARDKDALMRAALHKAHTVVILAEGTSIEADEKTLLRALAISRYCRKKTLESQHEKTENISELIELQNANKYEDKIYIIAELNDVSLTADLKNSDVNEIINSSEYSKNILIQSMFNHGVSKILDEVLSHNSYNEFYTINLREKQFKPLIGKTFDELLPVLRQKGILLIAIKVVYHDTNGNEIIDENRLLSLLQAEELERQVIVNPTKPREIDRKVDSDDQLIVFCTDYKVLTDFS